MAKFFQYFPKVNYSFGNGIESEFQNLSAYAEIVDLIKDELNYYTTYTILEGERPDQLSQKFYKSTNYHWLFIFMNDKIKESGWPLTRYELNQKMAKDLPNTVIRTYNDIGSIFNVGDTLAGNTSAESATIISRNRELGLIDGEVLTSGTNSIQLITSSEEINAVRYYVDGDLNTVDIDPFSAAPSTYTPISNSDYYHARNDELKEIKVVKKSLVSSIVKEFQSAMSSNV
jgi:hypothetical protein